MTQPGEAGKAATLGMPSTHALNLFYIASYFSTGWLSKCVYTINQIASREPNTKHGGVSHASPLHALAAVAEITGLSIASALLILLAGVMAYRRAQIGQHATQEVTYGILIGALCGLTWKLSAGDAKLCLVPLSEWMLAHGFYTVETVVRTVMQVCLPDRVVRMCVHMDFSSWPGLVTGNPRVGTTLRCAG